MQTQPGWAKGLSDGLPKLYAAEGLNGCAPNPTRFAQTFMARETSAKDSPLQNSGGKEMGQDTPHFAYSLG